MNERESISGGRTHFQMANLMVAFADHQSMKRVIEAIRPAAAGIGNPVNSCYSVVAVPAAATVLKRASRNAPQSR